MFPMDTVQCPPLDPGAPVDCVESAGQQISSLLQFLNNSLGPHHPASDPIIVQNPSNLNVHRWTVWSQQRGKSLFLSHFQTTAWVQVS